MCVNLYRNVIRMRVEMGGNGTAYLAVIKRITDSLEGPAQCGYCAKDCSCPVMSRIHLDRLNKTC